MMDKHIAVLEELRANGFDLGLNNDDYAALDAAIALMRGQSEPKCPECQATVLFECVECSHTNYPQDASGDAEDARRYRWLKDRSTRKSVMDSAKQNGPFIAIGSPLSGFHVPLDIDSAVDTAMQAKEAK